MIFVTGANGLLGSFTCRALIKAGYEVKALVRANSNIALLADIKEMITIVNGDILDPESISKELSSCDIIIHCAAVVSFHQSDKDLMNEVNIIGTGNMVNLALKHNIDYFIQISSVAALGRLLGSGIVDETSKWESSKWNSNYAQSKYFGELEVWRGAEEGLKTVILNPSVILAPGDWNRSSGRLFKYVWDENLFYPSGKINFVDVRDVVNSIIKCLELRPNKERFIVNSAVVSYQVMFEEIAKYFNKKAPRFKSSILLIKLGMVLDKIKSVITNQRTIITKETALLSKSEIYFNNAKILRELNLSFAPLSESIKWNCKEFINGEESEKIK
jgi:dihydroflavonol-4-reductase